MSNIAIGIGLSGKEQADTRGLEYLVAAEKDAAGRRIAEQSAKNKAKQGLVDDIMKNTAFKQQYNNAYYQKEFEKTAASKMADIVQSLDGDYTTNMAVVANNAMNELEALNRQWKIEDDQMTSVTKTAIQKPDNFFFADPKEIDGKIYNSPIEYVNSHAGEDDAAQKAADAWGANWYFNPIQDGSGRISLNFNPEMAYIENPYDVFKKGITKDDFTVAGKERIIKQGATTERNIPFHPSEESLMRGGFNVATSFGAGNSLLLDGYREAQKSNPALRFSDFMASMGENIGTYMDERISGIKEEMKKIEGRYESVTNTVPKPTAPKPSLFNKHYTVSDVGVTNENGKRITFNAISNSQGTVPINMPSDAKQQNSDGEWVKLRAKGTIEASPVGVQFNQGKLEFLVSAKDGGTLYAIPASQDAFNSIASGLYLTDPEEKKAVLLGSIQKVIEGQPEKIRDQYLEMLGLSAPKSPSKATTTRMDAQGRTYPSGAKTISLQDLPVGAKIESKNGKNYYNGLEITE